MTKAKRRILSLLLCAVILLGSTASAAPISYFCNNFPTVPQVQSNWCWAACGTAVLRWMGYSVPAVSNFVYAAIGSTANVPGGFNEINTAMRSLGGNKYFHSSITTAYSTPYYRPSMTSVVNWIGGNLRPIIACLFSTVGATSGGHLVVVYGYDQYTGNIWVMDPYPVTTGTKDIYDITEPYIGASGKQHWNLTFIEPW